ncbi:RpnC/YadD family protein, partial [Thiorhodovibrio frisius]
MPQTATALQQGNAALRAGQHAQAIRHYALGLLNDAPAHHQPQPPTPISQLLAQNLLLARKRYRRQHPLTGAGRRPWRVAVTCWSLSENPLGRAQVLASLYQALAEAPASGISSVAVIGSVFARRGRALWPPLREAFHQGSDPAPGPGAIPLHSFLVEDDRHFMAQAIDLVSAHPFDLVHISKPRMPNILLGLLYRLLWDARVLVDIDDDELAFVGAQPRPATAPRRRHHPPRPRPAPVPARRRAPRHCPRAPAERSPDQRRCSMNQDADDFDSPWKDALIHAFPDFMAFYFPRAAAQIDWSAGYTFLDQELRQVVRDAELGRRRLDVLVRVSDRDGSEHWLYIHVEIQSQRDDQLPERLYIYNYRLYDRYRRPIATLVVLADPSPTWKPRSFRARSLGCQIAMRFPVAKLMDARDRLEALLADPNPFALITAAHLLTQQTHGNHAERYTVKWRLARLLYQRRWERQRIIDLFAIIDWMMQLPKDLEHQL